VVDLQPGRSFTWLGHVGVNGLLDGRHTAAADPDLRTTAATFLGSRYRRPADEVTAISQGAEAAPL
jgi:hypothetical protein